MSTWGGGQVGVAQSWRWLRSGCPPPTLGSQFRAMSVPPGFSPCRPWRARTLEPNGRGHRDARGSAWDPSLPACPSAGTELWKRSDFLIPGFRQGFFFGNEASASLLPFSWLGVCCCRREGRLGDPTSRRADSCQDLHRLHNSSQCPGRSAILAPPSALFLAQKITSPYL